MTTSQIALLVLGASAGGFVNGLAGFGTALFALGFWLHFLEPARAVSVVVILSVVTGLQGVWVVRRSILDHPWRLARFMIPGLFGIPLGVASLSMIDDTVLKLIIAGMMLLYGVYFITRRNLPVLTRPRPLADALIGLTGGVMGGAASLSGALPKMWCTLHPWSKSETRAVLQPYNVAILGITAATFAALGIYDKQSLVLISIALPVAVIASQLGIFTFRRLNDTQFRKLLVGMMLFSGTLLIIRTAG